MPWSWRVMRLAGTLVAIALGVALGGAAPASANGQCGNDATGATACPVSANGAVSGTIDATYQTEYYVFYVAHRTSLQLTIDDTENASCSTGTAYGWDCGSAWVDLYTLHGQSLYAGNASTPSNGIAQPVSDQLTIDRGIYYAVVSGSVEEPWSWNQAAGAQSVPYQLTIDGDPGIQWPPACVVPRFRHHTGLRRVEQELRAGRCSPGKIHYVRQPGTPRGDVVSLRPRAGSVLPYGAPVAIDVAGPRRRHH